MLVLSVFKSKISHNRISKKYESFEWEYYTDIDKIRMKLVNTFYDFAIVDEKVLFSNDIIELLSVRNIKVIIFSGDFENLENQVNEISGIEDEPMEQQEVEQEDKDVQIKVIEREKIVEKEVIKKETVYKSVYSGVENKTIGVVSLSKGSGSSFITMNLVKAISDYNVLTSMVETPFDLPYFYDAFGIKNRADILEKQFVSLPHLISEGKNITKDMEFIDNNISYLVQDATLENIDNSNWSYNKMMKLLYNTRAPITIIDIGYNLNNKIIMELINDIDILLVIIDAIPSKVVNNYNNLNIIKNIDSCEVVFVINKYNSGVNKKNLLDYMNTKKEILTIPFCDIDLVYKSYNKQEFPYSNNMIKEILEPGFNKIIRKVLPIDLLKQEYNHEPKKKRFSIFKKTKE
jgi:hypothetical protein